MKPRGSRFGTLYGLCKVHKQLVDNCPTFGPIMSAIKTPRYNLAKFLVLLIEPITNKINTVKNKFEFAKKKVADQDPGLFMANLNVECLFTNIQLEKIFRVCCGSLFGNDAKVSNVNRINFENF